MGSDKETLGSREEFPTFREEPQIMQIWSFGVNPKLLDRAVILRICID